MEFYGWIFLLFIGALRVLPFAATILIASDFCHATRNVRSRVLQGSCTGIGVLLNLLAYMLVHKLLRGRWDILNTAKAVIKIDFTYQTLDYLPISLLLCLLFSIFLGLLLRAAFAKTSQHKGMGAGRKAMLLSIVSTMGMGIILLFYTSFSGTKNIVINEVGAYNHSVAVDDSGLVCDYIELYNNGNLDCEMYGLYLSDDPMNLAQRGLPAGIIPAKGYWLVKLDDDTLSVRKEGGETITLSDAAGNILDQVITDSVDQDYAYSRATDGATVWTNIFGTPGLPNSGGLEKLKKVPAFSHDSGFYSEAFSLHITAAEGDTIYYTLDGSLPTEESAVYSVPILVYDKSDEPNVFRSIQNVTTKWGRYTPDTTPVDKAFIVRAIAISANGAVSDPVTATYFVGLDDYKQKNVISLVADPDDMWGENGIYVTGKEYDQWYTIGQEGDAPEPNFNKHGREYEIEAHFSYFSNELRFEQPIGIRINGASARNNVLKRFSLYARYEYGRKRYFPSDLIGGTASRKLVLREGTANAVCQAITANRNVAVQRYRPVTVFLNGEFWYDTYLLEKYDDNYFQQHYGIDQQNIIVCDRYGISEGNAEDNTYWGEVYGYAKTHSLAEPQNYAELNTILDIQSYIDYMCINIYIDNMDMDDYKNVVAWKARTPGLGEQADGRWRLALYDLDALEWNDAPYWGLTTQAEKNTFQLQPRFAGAVNKQFLFSQLKQNPLFRQQFVNTFMDLVNNEFAYQNVERAFLTYNGAVPSTYFKEFFSNRAGYIVPYMAQEFALTGTLETLTLKTNDPAGGYIQINTITPDMTDGTWSGQYYTDYPVKVTAVANSGYEFVGWEGVENTDGPTQEIILNKGGMTLNAIFQKANTTD